MSYQRTIDELSAAEGLLSYHITISCIGHQSRPSSAHLQSCV